MKTNKPVCVAIAVLQMALLLVLAQPLKAQTNETYLMRNTDMHTGMINRIATDAAGLYALTASDDKTAKLWDLQTGGLLRTYRIPVVEGNEGKIYAAALSPDAKQLALGGWTGNTGNKAIYIFNTQSGELVRRITELPDVILDLEYSPDGRYLGATLGGKNGIRLYETRNYTLQVQDSDYGTDSYNIAFDGSGNYAAVCLDGYLRLYNGSGKLLHKTNQLRGSHPYSLAFSPDGSRLAVGFYYSPRVQVLDAGTLQLLYEPDISGGAETNDNRLISLCFSADGRYLWGGGSYHKKSSDGKWWFQLRRWSEAGKGSYTDFDAAQNRIMDIKALPSGVMLYAGSYPDWGIMPASGGKKLYHPAPTYELRANDKSHLRIDQSGSTVGFTPYQGEALQFSIADRRLSNQACTAPAPADQKGSTLITNWKNTTAPHYNGNNIGNLEQYETCRSTDIADDGRFVLGTNWCVRAYASGGSPLWATPVAGTAWAVNISGNGKVAVAAQGDGTLCWYRMTDGRQLLALYIDPATKRWVLYTPGGYYDAAPGAEELLGWHVNQGKEKEAAFYGIGKFKSQYYRPDVIDRLLELYDEDAALSAANAASGNKRQNTATVLQQLPPVVRLLSPELGYQATQTALSISYAVQSPNNEAVTGIKLLIDGRPVSNERGLKPAGGGGNTYSSTLTLPQADCTVSVIAENRFGSSEPATLFVRWAGKREEDLLKPKLYVLAIGISSYRQPGMGLNFAAKDARDFEAAMQAQKGGLYSEVTTRLLTDADATRDNIMDGLDWLQRQTTARDLAVLFFAGHGLEDNAGVFYFLPVNGDSEALKRTGINKAELQSTVASIGGKVVMFLDACHSGSVMKDHSARRGMPDINGLISDFVTAETGAVVFSSSTSRQYSLENATWNNGAFTKAVVEGFNGKADFSGKGKVTVKSLDAYIAERVKELTRGAQTPTTTFPPNVNDFPLGVVR